MRATAKGVENTLQGGSGTARIVVVAILALVLIGLPSQPAHAAQSYIAKIPNTFSPDASRYGGLTFWQAVKTRFTADMTLQDTECDNKGVHAYFNVFPVSGTVGYTRTFYWGGGCGGGNGTTGDFPNEYFDRPSNIDDVFPVVCLIDDGMIDGCLGGAGHDNPYT